MSELVMLFKMIQHWSEWQRTKKILMSVYYFYIVIILFHFLQAYGRTLRAIVPAILSISMGLYIRESM